MQWLKIVTLQVANHTFRVCLVGYEFYTVYSNQYCRVDAN
jgi:hypothetical protein